ncbi:LysR family transcriptional regulator [Marinomonas epiphytica]
MNASDLSLFACVADSGSFRKAAQLANLSTPALSKKISRLEQDLGVQLIHRTTRRLSLTEAGENLYVHAKNIDGQVNDAIASVSAFSQGFSGTVKMSVPTISGELLLTDAVAKFCQQHPQLSIDMRLENDFVDLIEEGLDIAIRTGVLDDSSLIAKPLIESHWVVCCAPSYVQENGLPEHPEALKEHNCLAYTYQARGSFDWRFQYHGQDIHVRIKGSMTMNNAYALRKAAIAGYGIIYVPKCCVYEDLQAGRLMTLLPGYEPRKLGVYAVFPYTKYLPEKLKLLIEHIKSSYHDKREYFC